VDAAGPLASPPAAAAGTAAALAVSGLTKVYAGGVRALDALDLEVRTGEFFGLLGPNGAGKSTLIGAVAGLVRVPAGHIRVFGHDAVADAGRARLAVGLAPQEIHLDRFLTSRETLVYHGRYFGMARRDADRRARRQPRRAQSAGDDDDHHHDQDDDHDDEARDARAFQEAARLAPPLIRRQPF
jgi:ABC-2 type transport system ATP-binding protein